MNIKPSLTTAPNQFNAPPVAAPRIKSASGYLTAGDETTEIAQQSADPFTERLANAFKTDNADIIRELDGLSDSDRIEIALNSYLQMQGRVQSALTAEKDGIRAFSELKDEKDYYNKLLEEAQEYGTAKIENGKYGFSDTEDGTKITENGIREKLDDVQERIDSFLCPYGKDEAGNALSNPANEKMTDDYRSYAELFRSVTGLDADCLDPGDSLLLHKLDRTEENYIKKADANIDSLRRRSEDLMKLKNKFLSRFDDKPEGADLSEDARARVEAFEFMREQFIYGNDAGTLNSLGLIDSLA